MDNDPWWLLALTVTVLLVLHHVAGVLLAVHALWQVRSTQGTIAWIMGLLLWPSLIVYLYLLFGMRSLSSFTDARRPGREPINRLGRELDALAREAGLYLPIHDQDTLALCKLSRMPPIGGNRTELLIDGEATFTSILTGIRAARLQIVVQFYIIRDDDLGRRFADVLCERARAGVSCWLLYDGIGCFGLAQRWLDQLIEAGVHIAAFTIRRLLFQRWRINFRNHRKVVVVDGRNAWIGGHNIGDEYLGKDPALGRWRDTHLLIEGPAALACQLSFAEDWYWIAGELPSLDWYIPPAAGAEQVLILPTGPGDPVESAQLMFLGAITNARRHLWLASPYFVPDEALTGALRIAALRGVEIHILLPRNYDQLAAHLAAYSFVQELSTSGIRFHSYPEGFMHQKVVLVDDRYALIGTTNLDNRSVHVNFEIMAMVNDPAIVQAVRSMLEADLAVSEPLDADALEQRSYLFRIGARLARLFSPLL